MHINKTFERIIVSEIYLQFPSKKVGKPRIFSTSYVVDYAERETFMQEVEKCLYEMNAARLKLEYEKKMK